MANRKVETNVMAFALVVSGRRATPTCPTSMDGATELVEDNVRKRTSVGVVRGGSGAGIVLAPTRYRPGDVGGFTYPH